MLAKLRRSYPLLFAVLIYVIFFVGMNGTGFIEGALVKYFFGGEVTAVADQVLEIVCELVPALIFVFILSRTGRLGLLTKKGKGFVSGLAVGGYCIAFISFVVWQSVMMALTENTPVNFAPASVAYIAAMLMVGVTEEIEARVLIGETFLEHFGTSRAGAIKAVVASGLIFGAMHLTNALHGDLPGTLVQVMLCVTGGVLYGAIYFRCGNLWSIALIHGLNDVAAGTMDWLFNGGVSIERAASAITATDLIYPLIIAALDLSVAFFLLRPKKAGEVAKYWPEIGPGEGVDGDPAAVETTD